MPGIRIPRDRPLFPRAWKYYNAVVVLIGAALMILNTLVGSNVFNNTVEKWLSLGIYLLIGILLWVNERRIKLAQNGSDPVRK